MRVPTGSLLAVIAFTSACSSGGVGASCHTDIDCGTGLYCGGGSCVLSASTLCSVNSDCTNGQSCVAGVCSTGSGTGLSNSGSGSGSVSGSTSGSASGSGTSSGSSSGSSTAYYGAACMQDTDCNPPGWGGFTGNGSPGNSCQNDLNGNLCCAVQCPSNGAACPSGSQCNATTNSNGADQILQCIAAMCPVLTTSSTTSSSGTVSSTTTTSTSGGTTTTTSSSTTTTTTTTSSSTSGCTSWNSTSANSFYTTYCNYCHGHSWTYTSGCSDSEVGSKIQSGSMPPYGSTPYPSSTDVSTILQYISCQCPQ
jgi:hypothetical protein